MFNRRNLSAVAFAAAIAAPLAAQGAGSARETVDAAQRRAQIENARTEARRRAEVEGARTAQARVEAARTGTSARTGSSRVPRGHLPPRGMCRVWVDGVPPGQQAPVTSCAQAERDRLAYGMNARVIYGDVESFPGRGKGKFKQRQDGTLSTSCVYRDAVVVGGRVVNVCRDANGNVVNREGRVIRGDDDDDDDDDDRFENANRGKSRHKAQKSGKKGGKGRD